jgi:hypothetical protein
LSKTTREADVVGVETTHGLAGGEQRREPGPGRGEEEDGGAFDDARHPSGNTQPKCQPLVRVISGICQAERLRARGFQIDR